MSHQKRKSRRAVPDISPGHRGNNPLGWVDWDHADHPDVDRRRDEKLMEKSASALERAFREFAG